MADSTSVAKPHRGASPRARLGRRLGLRAGDALLVVDVQRDFLPGGRLAVPGGEQTLTPLNAYIAAFEARGLPIVMTRDWHPANHCSFTSAGGRWPPHCVEGSPGAEFPDALHIAPSARIISKGSDPYAEAYSGFSGTQLSTLLRDLEVRRVFIGGLATDYCVRATVLDARTHGFDVVVLSDAIKGVNTAPGEETHAIAEMLAHGATLFQSSDPPG